MANVASLWVSLNARTGKFDKNIERSRKQMSLFTKTMKTAKIAAAGFVAGAVVGMKKLADAVQESRVRLDELAKTARNLGIAPDELAAMRFAASQTGVDISKLDKALQKFLVRMGEARSGMLTSTRAFETLGLEIGKVSEMPIEQAFGIVADRLNEIEVQADKARAAYELFGRGGVEIMNTLGVGSKGLREYAKASREIGQAFESFDLAKVEAANDALDRMERNFQAIIDTLTVKLAPALERFARAIELMVQGEDPVGAWMRAADEQAERSYLAFKDQVFEAQKLVRALAPEKDIEAAFEELNRMWDEQIDKRFSGMETAFKAINNIRTKAWGEYIRNISSGRIKEQRALERRDIQAKQARRIFDGFGKLGEAAKKVAEDFQEAGEKLIKKAGPIPTFEEIGDRFMGLLGEIRKSAEAPVMAQPIERLREPGGVAAMEAGSQAAASVIARNRRQSLTNQANMYRESLDQGRTLDEINTKMTLVADGLDFNVIGGF